MIGLGRILADARAERGVSLEEAERETRISRRYLLALETEEFDAFPARVQARGFLRVYAQYLILDPAEMLALFPHDSIVEDLPPFAHSERIFRERPVRTAASFPALNLRRPGVLLAAAYALMIVLCGLLAALSASGDERARVGLALLSRDQGGGALLVPDVHDQPIAEALARLEQAGIRPLVLEVRSERVAAGLVLRQYPRPGAAVARGSDVTLIVSRGLE